MCRPDRTFNIQVENLDDFNLSDDNFFKPVALMTSGADSDGDIKRKIDIFLQHFLLNLNETR